MKKTMLVFVMLVIMILCGCVRKNCIIVPPLLETNEASSGSVMIRKFECFGRIWISARDCTEPLEVLYLGRTHPGNYLRMASRVGSRSQFIAEATYPENSKVIHFQDAQIEVIEASDNWIKFKLISISTSGCDKVKYATEVK